MQRWMRKAPRNSQPAKRWAAFLSNHREAVAAMDFFTVPTLTFGVLYCFFVIAHDRRRILHCNMTKYPTSAWLQRAPWSASHFLLGWFSAVAADGMRTVYANSISWPKKQKSVVMQFT